MTDLELFDDAPYRAVLAPPATLPSERRRTPRQLAELALERHPLTDGPLHPESGEFGARYCGNCRWSQRPPDVGHYTCHQRDTRAWWPGCAEHELREDA